MHTTLFMHQSRWLHTLVNTYLFQICGTAIFILLHVLQIPVNFITLLSMEVLTATGYLVVFGYSRQGVKTCILFGGFLFGLSPIIQTLTRTISSDTIYSVIVISLLINFLLQNYSFSKGDYMSNCVSLNAGIFAAVCLASRVDNLNNVLATIILSILVYGLLPHIRRKFPSVLYQAFLTVTMVTITCMLAWCTGYSCVIVCVLTAAILCLVVVPFIFIQVQKQKDNIYGPWDEAELKDHERDMFAE